MHEIRNHKGGRTDYDAVVRMMLNGVGDVLCILINRKVQGHLIPRRGIRRGDFLSILSKILLRFEERKLFKGVQIANGRPSILYLFFTYDNLYIYIYYCAKP